MDIVSVLNDLTAATGVSGLEKGAAEVAQKYLSEFGKTHIDTLGSVICEIEGEGSHILLDAHIDQVGMIVTSITEDGFLRVAACGGIDNRTLCAQEVTVHGSKDITGVVISVPPHLQKSEDERKTMKTDEAIIDIGMNYKQATAVVSLGDRITVNSPFLLLAGNRLASPAFDDRCGMAAILFALEYLKNKNSNRRITVVFSTREETTESGAKVASYVADADEFIAVDVSFAKTPDSKAQECGELDKGPMIGVSSSLTEDVSNKLKEIAAQNEIPYQLEIIGGSTGTNADVISVSGKGLRSGLVSVPLRYMHTGVEVISKADIENTGVLIAEYVIDGGDLNA